jgi:acetoin utilization deacetylase AcuC-like enzyme
MMHVYYSAAYTMAGHAFDTTRKAGWIAESLRVDPIPGVTLAAPEPASEEQIRLAHGADYVQAVRTGSPRALATSSELGWDAGLWPMVRASTGGAIAAVLTARSQGIAGSLSSGLHHARRDRGAGYCTFNGLAIAAREAMAAGARSVLILDLDAHCGGGTHELVGDEPRIWHADVAVDAYDRYDPDERGMLTLVTQAADYLPAVARTLADLDARGTGFDVCLYNAGMDPFEGCAVGGLAGITRAMLARREEMVFAWRRRLDIPMAFVLAGGYVGGTLDQAGLVDLHRLTLGAASASEAQSGG